MPPSSPQKTAVSSDKVHDHERFIHLGKPNGEPLVGLALSGGGIRSATFGLGILQAMRRLGLFSSLDYVSTVSGGGYIGGWLQAVLANGIGLAALDLGNTEPREVRFLRGFSNYLTPKLGLFSGDTWAAVGVSLRNLILNFTILSLSLAVPLFLPWVVAILFWTVAAWHVSWGVTSCLIVVATAAVLLALPTFVGTINMARPTRDGKWTKSGTSRLKASTVYATAVIPSLVAVGLASGLTWAQASGASRVISDGMFLLAGALAYGGAWLLGLVLGFVVGNPARNVTTDQTAPLNGNEDQALGRAIWAGAVLICTGLVAGLVGTAVWLYGSKALIGAVREGPRLWRLSLLVFPLGVASLFLCVTTHLGLAGRRMSEETREWWGRVGGIQLLVALLLTVVGIIALAGPHLPAFLARQWAVVWGAPDGRHERPRRPVGGADRGRRRRRPQRAHGRRRAGAPGVDRTHRTGYVRDRLPADPVQHHSRRRASGFLPDDRTTRRDAANASPAPRRCGRYRSKSAGSISPCWPACASARAPWRWQCRGW